MKAFAILLLVVVLIVVIHSSSSSGSAAVWSSRFCFPHFVSADNLSFELLERLSNSIPFQGGP